MPPWACFFYARWFPPCLFNIRAWNNQQHKHNIHPHTGFIYCGKAKEEKPTYFVKGLTILCWRPENTLLANGLCCDGQWTMVRWPIDYVAMANELCCDGQRTIVRYFLNFVAFCLSTFIVNNLNFPRSYLLGPTKLSPQSCKAIFTGQLSYLTFFFHIYPPKRTT